MLGDAIASKNLYHSTIIAPFDSNQIKKTDSYHIKVFYQIHPQGFIDWIGISLMKRKFDLIQMKETNSVQSGSFPMLLMTQLLCIIPFDLK